MNKRGLFVVVVLVLLIGGIWFVLKSSTNQFLEQAKKTQSLNNMHELGLAVLIYQRKHGGQWPDQLSQVVDILGARIRSRGSCSIRSPAIIRATST